MSFLSFTVSGFWKKKEKKRKKLDKSHKKVLQKPRPLPPLGSYKQSWVHTHRKLCDLSSLLINDKNNNFGKLTQQPTDTSLQFQLDEQARGETKKEEWSPPGQVQRGQIARKNNEITPLTSAFAAALRTSAFLSVSSGAPEAVSAPSPAVPSRAGLEPESGRAARNFLQQGQISSLGA